MVLSLPATVLLWRRGGNLVTRLGLLVFGLSMSFCYAASALFHAIRGPAEQIRDFDRLDHIGIFLLIAGTYTPLALCVLHGWWRRGTLVAAWLLATAGGVFDVATDHLSGGLANPLLPGDGLGRDRLLLRAGRRGALSHRSLSLLLIGGVLYTTGAVLNLSQWPVLWPGVFGPHELFHVFVMAGSLVPSGS